MNAYDCEGRTPIMLAMDRGNRRLFQKIVRGPLRSKGLAGLIGWRPGPKVEKKSNLDVLDKRGWNVVIYAIETQMLTDAGNLDLILAGHPMSQAITDAML